MRHFFAGHCGLTAAPCGRGRAAFALMEVLVVIAILLTVMAIAAAVYARMRVAAKSQAAMTAFGSLCDASLRYQQIVPLPLFDRDAGLYFVDFNNDGIKNGSDRALSSMEYFILRTSDVPDCQAQLNHVPKEMMITEQAGTVGIRFLSPANTAAANTLVKTGYTLQTVKDLWGVELKFRSLSNATLINLDASVGERDAAIPYADFPFFASAGPDGLWGALTAHNVNSPNRDAKDNLYSFTAHQ